VNGLFGLRIIPRSSWGSLVRLVLLSAEVGEAATNWNFFLLVPLVDGV